MEFDRFVERVGALLQIEIPKPVNPYDSLYEDLGLDSVRTFELLIVVESLADCLVPPEDVPELRTLADAFEHYRRLRAAAAEWESLDA